MSKELVKYWRKLTKQAREQPPQLVVSQEAVAFIRSTAAQSPLTETGGILIGFHEGRDIRVTKATDAGPGARRSQCGFLRDTGYCQGKLNEEFAQSGADYVGEWHSHVIDLPRPSSGDLETLSRIILDPDYRLASFAMILAVVLDRDPKLLTYMVSSYDSPKRSGETVVTVSQVIPVVEGAPSADEGGTSGYGRRNVAGERE